MGGLKGTKTKGSLCFCLVNKIDLGKSLGKHP